MGFENLIFAEDNGIATLTFNRPKALNALNFALLAEFVQALEEVARNEAIRVLILTGAGDKAFVAGADISEIARCSVLQARRFAELGQGAIGRLQRLAIPVIAAVNGFALGGGSEIALGCDFIYASEKATFGLPEINLGIIPGFGGTQRLPRRVGIGMAKELILTGRMLGAAEAREIGLVNRVCPPEALMAAAMETARTMAAKGKAALRAAKGAINAGLDVDLESGCRMERDAFALCLASPDAREGTGAFLEKRKPVFGGGLND
jgi:enoyl-CoA hydratase